MKKFIKYLLPYWYYVILVIALIVVQVQLELKLPEYVSQVTYSVMGVTTYAGKVIRPMGQLIPIMIGISVGAVACAVLAGLFASLAGSGMARDMRGKIFDKVQDFSMEEIEGFSTGGLITRSTNDVNQVQMTVIMCLRFLVMCPAMAITAIVKVVLISPNISLVIAGGIVLLLLTIGIVFIFAIPKFKVIQTCTDNFNKVGRESLTGVRVVRAYNAEKDEEEKFDEVNQKTFKTYVYVDKIMACTYPLLSLLMNGLIVVIMLVAAFLIKSGDFTKVGELSEFFTYTMHIVMSFMFLAMMFIMLPRGAVSAKRIDEVLTKDPSIKDLDETKCPANVGSIEFKDVSFKYPDGSDYVLENINLTVNPGEVVAFIGSTGSGKTTLINLIPRFYDTSAGQVFVDGVDVKELAQKDLRNRIGFVPQKGVLFSGTVKENVDFAGKGLNDEDIQKACKIAQASDFIENREEGYNYNISQGGINVSGGQKQRLAIARAIAKKSKIYIFDDTFSALDFKTDKQLRRALANETDGATCLIVAQRIGTIKNADKIVVLEEGKIVGMGKHKELLDTCQIYREIAESQLSKEEILNA